jgi:hypothetical protein
MSTLLIPRLKELPVPVKERCSAGRDFLLAQILVEEHRRIRDRPREIYVLSKPLGRRNTVLQSSLVEHVGRELGKARVHTILHLETDRTITEHDKPFE